MLKLIDVNKRGETVDFTFLGSLEKVLRRRFRLTKRISIAMVTAGEMRRLNRVYRHKDKITDVLSFPFKTKDFLGEVVICMPQARRQAKQNKHSLKAELKFLTVHGILHLLGYDHELGASAEARQDKMQTEILELL